MLTAEFFYPVQEFTIHTFATYVKFIKPICKQHCKTYLVGPMLSFEISVIDVVLLIAIIIVLLLQITRTPKEYTREPEMPREERKPLEKLGKNTTIQRTSKKKESSHTRSLEGPVECPHHFGYLKTLPPGSSVPDECYSCSRMMQCLYSSEQTAES